MACAQGGLFWLDLLNTFGAMPKVFVLLTEVNNEGEPASPSHSYGGAKPAQGQSKERHSLFYIELEKLAARPPEVK